MKHIGFHPLTFCGTRKLPFFYAKILPELKKKNRPMPKIINAICKNPIKVKTHSRFLWYISAPENFE